MLLFIPNDIKEACAMRINPRKFGVRYILIALFIAIVYSFRSADWTTGIYGAVYKRANTSSSVYLFLVYSALIMTVLLGIKHISRSKDTGLYALSLSGIVGVYFLKTIVDDGVYAALTNPTTPLVFLLVLAIYIGMQDELWMLVEKMLPIFIVCFLGLLAYEYIMLFNQHGVTIIGNSSVIYYYVDLFWCVTVYLTCRILRGRELKWYHLFLLVVLIVVATVINSRSWIIQACIVTVGLYLFAPSRLEASDKIKRILAISVISLIAWRILNTYFSGYLSNLFDKIGNDSRSHQYGDIFGASSPIGWLFGNGALATYADSRHGGEIASIDNQYLFVAFHYGAIVLMMWLIPQVKICLSTLKKLPLIAILPVLCWFMALGGLSVFNAIYCHLKQVVVMLYIGHVLSLCESGKLEYNGRPSGFHLMR